MRSPISTLELMRAATLTEALGLLAEDPSLRPLAGCTDVYVELEFGQTPARRFLDLWRHDELRGISERDGALVIGALTTYTEMIRSELVQSRLPMMVAAARLVGGVQIQNRGTLGGNIANASPAGDALPVLAAADAIVVLQSAAGTRRVALREFYTGYRQTVRRPDELIVAVEVPHLSGRQWFRKVGTRAAQAISKVVMAAVRSDPPRIALGSVAPTVVRLPRTERALATGSLADAQAVLPGEIAPIDDLRSTAAYRLKVAGNLLARFWHDTAQ